jgi:DNA-binding response OmpR family regulator
MRVLTVDDDRQFASILALLLESAGISKPLGVF